MKYKIGDLVVLGPTYKVIDKYQDRMQLDNYDWYTADQLIKLPESYTYINKENDPVNHPNHYTNNTIECIDVILDVCKHLPGDEAALVANTIKYLWRYQHKGNPLEDVKKAQWYINKLVEVMEGKQNDKS